MSRIPPHLVVVLALGLLFACKHETPKPAPAETVAAAVAPPPPPSPSAEAEKIFKTRCSVCHGMQGQGDGPGAAALNPKPRAFADKTWQASVDDAHLAKVIVEGGAAVKLSPGMAANPDLQSKPDVVAELIKIVRAFGK
jgi:mono/diheme cytochrome c family protein